MSKKRDRESLIDTLGLSKLNKNSPIKQKKQLESAEFRWINEKLYTSTSEQAQALFKETPEAFKTYHNGFRTQVQKWPLNPIDLIAEKILQKPPSTIADLGCGDAQLALKLKAHKTLSFDLVSLNERVTVCDISNLPLKKKSVDIVVFCLSLMGTNFTSFLNEAHRILKPKGTLYIAEVESRFVDVSEFVKILEQLGFKLIEKNTGLKMFFFFEFQKMKKNAKDFHPSIEILKPCHYKKR